MIKQVFFYFAVLATCLVQSQPIDLKTLKPIVKNWMEFGFTDLSTSAWTTITTETGNYTDPIVLLSLPQTTGSNYSDSFPSALRVKDVTPDANGFVTFKAKIYVPNDTFCLSTWYHPSHHTFTGISWSVVQKGSYSLKGNYFMANSGSLTRTQQTIDPSQIIQLNYQTGCIDPNNVAGQCAFNSTYDVDGDLAFISTLQTANNDRYLMTRGQSIALRWVKLVLTPHDSLTASYYNIPNAETVGFLAFPKDVHLACKEDVSFETARYADVSSNAVYKSFVFTYLNPPGVYGLLNSQISVTDSTALRQFDTTNTQAGVITREDQCSKEGTQHTTPEVVGLFSVGQTHATSDYACFIVYPEVLVPCSTVYTYDLFGDGWGENIQLHVTTWGDFEEQYTKLDDTADTSFISVRNYTVDCVCDKITFCSQSGEFNVSVITMDDEPVREPWEVYWTYIDNEAESWFGDIDTEIGIHNDDSVWFFRDLATEDMENETCIECPPKPAPAPKDAAPEEDAEEPPKNPPAFIDIAVADPKQRNGWCEAQSEDGMVYPCLDVDLMDDNVYDDYVQPSYPYSLIYPKYFISDADRTHLIKTGTLHAGPHKWCHEHLPRDGEFVLRFGGFEEVEGTVRWDFCGAKGGINEEVQFRMHHGHCEVTQQFTSDEYCALINSLAIMKGSLLLKGMTTADLTSTDTLALQRVLSLVLQTDVTVTAWEAANKGVVVSFSVSMVMEDYGFQGSFTDMKEAFMDSLTSTLETADTQGFFMNLLNKELTTLSSTQDILYSVTAINLLSFDLVEVKYSCGGDKTIESPVLIQEQAPTLVASESKESQSLDYAYGMMVFAMVVVGGAFVIYGAIKTRKYFTEYQPLPEASAHEGNEHL